MTAPGTLGHDRSAVVSVELALLASLVLVPLVLGAADGGLLLMVRSRLDQALHEALFYAWSNPLPVSTSAVQSAAATASGSATSPAVTATTAQYCIDPTVGYPPKSTPPQPAQGVCATATPSVQTYLVVTASSTVTLPISLPWAAQTMTLSVSGRARVQ